MIYQVRANLYFDEKDEAEDFYHDCEIAFPKSTLINPDSENTEHGTIELIQNYHDKEPNSACFHLQSRTTEGD